MLSEGVRIAGWTAGIALLFSRHGSGGETANLEVSLRNRLPRKLEAAIREAQRTLRNPSART
jgi:hypothetical protein